MIERKWGGKVNTKSFYDPVLSSHFEAINVTFGITSEMIYPMSSTKIYKN